MRFDKKCNECVYFKKPILGDVCCANNDGEAWDPVQKACDEFRERPKDK